LACRDHLRAVSVSLANRTLLQMDKAAPSYQGVLRNIRERSQDANLDRSSGLRAHRYREKTSQFTRLTLRTPTNSEPHHVRANTPGTAAHAICIARKPEPIAQPASPLRITLGQQCL